MLTSSVCSKFVMYLAPAYSLMVSRAVASEGELMNMSTKGSLAMGLSTPSIGGQKTNSIYDLGAQSTI
jgi:hypothetical protein